MPDFYHRLIRKSLFILSGILLFPISIFVTPAAAADTPISFGETISSSISSLGEIDKYIFDALAGDRLALSMSATSYMDSHIRLYAPDGSLIDEDYNTSGPGYAWIRGDPLPDSGTYTVLAKDYGDNETGSYRIFLQRLNNPGMTTTIGFGETVSAALSVKGEVDTYTFNALEGDLLAVSMSTTTYMDPYIQLFAPDGSLIDYGYDTSGPAYAWIWTDPLPASGTYTVLSFDRDSNENSGYRIFFQRLNNPQMITHIGFGETVSAALSVKGEVDTYTFNALEGDLLAVSMSTTTYMDPYIRLFAPDGSLIDYGYDTSGPAYAWIWTDPLPASGTYTVLSFDRDSNENSGYRIFLQRLNNPGMTTTIGFGETVSAALEVAGEVDTYAFDALEGNIVIARMSTATRLDPYIRLYRPDGSLIDYNINSSGPGATEITTNPLPASGTYTVLAFDLNSNEGGNYSINLIRLTGTENSLYVTPSLGLNSAGIEGGPFASNSITYTVKNVGTGPINWTISKGVDWLDLSKPDNILTLAADATDTVTISINAQADVLTAGAYFDSLAFTNITENNIVIFRNVALLVKTPEGSLVVTPHSSFSSTGPRHGPFTPSTMTYTLKNVGDALMNWKVTKTAYWLDLSDTEGILHTGGTVDVRVDMNEAPNDFAWGLYKDIISFINTTNGNGDTLRDVVLTIEAIPSEITCDLSKSSIVLGEPLEVTGQITPQPNQSGAFVDITLKAPDASENHRSVVANALGEFSYAVACDDINQAGTWTVRCSWSGDEGLYSATSDDQNLEVIKAESRLTINSTSQALKIDVPVDISGKFTPLPDCGGDLTGIAIDLKISGPGGVTKTETVITNDLWGHYALQDYTGFDELGDWTVEAVFSGNAAFASSRSEILKVKVVETAGYAIVVQGKIASNEGLASHNKTANYVYKQLIARGLQPEDIVYFNYDDEQPGWDGVPDKSSIQDAVTTWAFDKLKVKPANLYLVLIDHGFDNVFYIYPDTISALELKGWLDTLQTKLAPFPQALEQEKIIILGFCRSGSFIDELSGDRRVIITSAAAHESSYKGPLDADGIREGEYFINEFFKNISLGKSVKQSFQEAVVLTENFTASDSANSTNGPYFDKAHQHPLLDDNGDNVGSNDVTDPTGDGLISADLFIGVNTLTTNDPEDIAITQVADTVFLNENQSTSNLWARVDNNSRLDTLWIEIKPTGFVPSNQGGSEQIEMDLIKAVFDSYNSTLDRYEWISQDGFSDPGTYQVFYFAKDNLSTNVSPLRQTTVYKAKSGNLPPNSFSLLLPEDGATDITSLILDWQDTTDPEGDTFIYTVLLSKGEDTFNNPIRKEGLLYSTTLITPDDGLEDLSTYYWKVHAIDAYGATRESDVRVFHTNNTNPVAGWIHGHVSDVATDQSISQAKVSVGIQTFTTEASGYFLGLMQPGNYPVTVSADGYNPASFSNVSIPEGAILTKDFGLDILDPDSDGDSISDSIENSSCTDPFDADTDDDCILDGVEDVNHNGSLDPNETDPCYRDTDRDGIQDGTELGYTLSDANTDTNPSLFQPDLDPSTTTDPLDADSDNDSLLDGQEDANHNGRVDSGETDPTISDLARLNAMPWIPLLLLDE